MSADLQPEAQQLFETHLPLIQELIRHVTARQRLGREEAQDFSSYVFLSLIENDYGVLRSFQGKSRLRTYLITVIHRLFLDYRIGQWGKWRPSARARQMGEVAVRLDLLIHRDGHSAEQAVDLLRASGDVETSREELLEMAARLPARLRPRFEGEERLGDVPTDGQVEELVLDQERAATARRVRRTLEDALSRLDAEDRLLLKMRYEDGFTVRRIASALHLEERPLFRRFERCLKTLRAIFEQDGLSFPQIATVIGWGLDAEPAGLRKSPAASPSQAAHEQATSRRGNLARLSRA